MKKLLSIAVFACLLASSNAMAWWINGGLVGSITANQAGTMAAINAYSQSYQYTLNPNQNTKEMLSLLLTAQSTRSTVNVEIVGTYINSVVVVSD